MRLFHGFLAAALLVSPAVAQESPRGNASNGGKVYVSHGCYQCHGTTGRGAGREGPTVSHTELPFEAFRAQIRMPATRMPAYSDIVLTDSEIADLYAFVEAIPQSPPASSIPLLNR